MVLSSQKGYLVLHMKVHENVKPFWCEMCGKRFNFKMRLQKHMEMHLGIKPYNKHEITFLTIFLSADSTFAFFFSTVRPYVLLQRMI
jgi:uncharacterized Zn-finger protein